MRESLAVDLTIHPHPLVGTTCAIASKSLAHRALILAALCPQTTDIFCPTSSDDIDATVGCLEALGARIVRTSAGFRVRPIPREGGRLRPREAVLLDCKESASTLRFMLPLACSLGVDATLEGQGRLAERPLLPLSDELVRHGADLDWQGRLPLRLSGTLRPGEFRLPGNVSSQYVSGLLLASTALEGPVCVLVEEPVESRSYIGMTIDMLASFGAEVETSRCVRGGGPCWGLTPRCEGGLVCPGTLTIEGDWSCGAFWLCAGAIGGDGIKLRGLDMASKQGDRAMALALESMGAQVFSRADGVSCRAGQLGPCRFDASDTPDLVPPLAVACAFARGDSRITGVGRLRLKESDRVETVCLTLRRMGARVSSTEDAIEVLGSGSLAGGEVDASGDHRIVMMAAVAAAYCTGPTTIHAAECVSKSYPAFFDDFRLLGGIVEGKGA